MDTPLWQDAVSYAARRHRHQVRKDGETPYIAHVVRVALTVRDLFGCDDPVAVTAALLHDTIEDTGADYDEIEERFGAEVAACVAALTKTMALPEERREREYDAGLAKADWRARLIKLGDVYDNLSDLHDRSAGGRRKVVDKCERAIALAEGDAAAHACSARAIEAVRGLVKGKPTA